MGGPGVSSARPFKSSMSNDSKTSSFVFLAAFIIWSIIVFIGGFATSSVVFCSPAESQVDTLMVHDTIKLTGVTQVDTIVVKLPIAVKDNKKESNANTFANYADSLRNQASDTVFVEVPIRDSIAVEVPIEQRTYEGDYYTAVVQGFRPELVSIDIKVPEVTTPVVKRKWWSVSIGPQVGFGFTPAGWQPYAGIGVSVGINL